MDIMTYFPKHLKEPRQGQVEILLELQRVWDNVDVVIINAPVALGKSAIAYTIASWTGDATIITPNNLLKSQYVKEYPTLHVINKKADYWCETTDQTVESRYKKVNPKKQYCWSALNCPGCDGYRAMRDGIETEPVILGNYYGYLGYTESGSQRKTLIIDEAHNLTGMLRELAGHKFWQFDWKYSPRMRSRVEMMEWAESLTDEDLAQSGAIRLFKEQILSETPSYLFQMSKEYHGQKDATLQVLKMLPVDTRGLTEGSRLLWPLPAVCKVVLMSATISQFDIDAFGLQHKRVHYIEADSPIPASRRPVIVPSSGRNMARKHQPESLPYFTEFVKSIAALNPDTKGLLHVPYNLAADLRPYLAFDPRYMWHDRKDKLAQYEAFRASPDPSILVASGMYEGIDLPDDLCRWQIIAKIPYPSLADPALRWMATRSNKWYAWQSIKDTLQASGRVCRHPDDYGETYIFDSCFLRLYERNTDMFPVWFREAVRYG